MNADIVDIIKNKYDSLPDSQKLVAEAVIKDISMMVTNSALQIANKVGVSDATVIRFAISLGFSGYSDMQNFVRKAFVKGRTLRKLETSIASNGNDDIFLRVCQAHKNLIDMAYENISRSDFNRVVSLILEADHIYTMGFRSSFGPSYYFGNLLRLFLGNASVLTLEEGHFYESLMKLSDKDLVIGISFSRYSKISYDILEIVKEKGAKIITISDSLLSPISKFADVQLTVPTDISTPYDSIIGLVSLIEAILSFIAIKSTKRVESNLDDFEKTLASRVFIK